MQLHIILCRILTHSLKKFLCPLTLSSYFAALFSSSSPNFVFSFASSASAPVSYQQLLIPPILGKHRTRRSRPFPDFDGRDATLFAEFVLVFSVLFVFSAQLGFFHLRRI